MITEIVRDYDAMSSAAASIIYVDVMLKLSRGERYDLGLATGNTPIRLYEELAEKLNAAKADLSLLSTWNLDEYATSGHEAIPVSHPLSYRRFMEEKLFSKFDPNLGFDRANAHFPDPGSPADYDEQIAAAGGIDLQLLGIGFNGHIAFNEPMSESEISVADFAALPTRVLPLSPETIAQNTAVTAGGDESLMPRFAVTMGMSSILSAKKCLLLACFAEQERPLRDIVALDRPSPLLPASYLWNHPDYHLIYTADKITL